MTTSVRTRVMTPAIVVAVIMGATVAYFVSSQPRFTPLDPSEIQQYGLPDTAALLVTAVEASVVSETTNVKNTQAAQIAEQIDVTTPSTQTVSLLNESVELSSHAEQQVKDVIDQARTTSRSLENTGTRVQATVIGDVDVEATRDTDSGRILAKVTTHVAETWDTGVVSESEELSLIVLNENGEVLSFRPLTDEELAAVADTPLPKWFTADELAPRS